MKDNHNNECKCAFCGNNDFEVPKEIIEEIKKENVVIFAGAGISTEGKNVYKSTLYSEINDELNEDYNNTFPELMSKYCNKPNGRRKLINKIMERFDYYKSFSEIDNVMNLFFNPLSDIYGIKEIITTNWDRQFEEKCGCMPVVYDGDIPLLDDTRRKVYKIHGSIDNISTLIMTESDYDKCYDELRENLIGGRIKELLSRKTVVFIGYSLEDEDFKKIWQFIDDKLGDLKPHFYIVSPDEKIIGKLKDKNVTVINTLGSNFIKKIRQQLIEEKYLLDSKILYDIAKTTLSLALDMHNKTNKMMREEKNPLLVYSIFFQDGIIHSLKRIIARQSTGEYLNPIFLQDSLRSYYSLYNDYIKENHPLDGAYICGYAHEMDFVFHLYNCFYNEKTIESDDIIYLYYLPKKNIYNVFTDFKDDLDNYKTKKYINIAKKLLENIGNSEYKFDIHHPPFL